jgi:hypothetical protein
MLSQKNFPGKLFKIEQMTFISKAKDSTHVDLGVGIWKEAYYTL